MTPFIQQIVGAFIGTGLAMGLTIAALALIVRRDAKRSDRP